MLNQNYEPIEGVEPMTTWAPEDVKQHIDAQVRINRELGERGELVEAQALTGLSAKSWARPASFDTSSRRPRRDR
jgi:hypothetical protein